MAQYLLSVWHEDAYEVDFSTPDAQRRMSQVGEFNTQLIESGKLAFAGGLQPNSTAIVFRLNDGPDDDTVTMTEGPFSDEPKQMGGFWVIEVDSADEATELAQQAAAACEEFVELRPFQVH